MPKTPAPFIQTTSLWDFPSQNYGPGKQGDTAYIGATPSYIIWNMISKYTKTNDVIIDPFCGSGTTIDVAADLRRQVKGFDLSPSRDDIIAADARNLPVKNGAAHLVFMDPPYADHITYSDHPDCIGSLSVYEPAYFQEMEKVFKESSRILKQNCFFGLYVCDHFTKKKGYVPVGMKLFRLCAKRFNPIDTICVVRHNKDLKKGNYHKAAEEQNFHLRGFNYLFIMQKK
jgi:SAM-dependent methyltransferase